MRLLAVDPGPALSAWVELEHGRPVAFGHDPTPAVVARVLAWDGPVAIEMIACYGMGVGKEVFETCLEIGRMDRDRRAQLVYRLDVKMHFCKQARAKDGNVRTAIVDRFGGPVAIGKKKSPGPLYGVSGDVWQALALGLFVSDTWL